MYQQDWILRQIESIIHLIAKLLFKEDVITYEIMNETDPTDTDELYLELVHLLSHLNINEAENRLFERIETGDLTYLRIAVDFYSRVNMLSDAQLEEHDFSREEIKAGLEDLARMFNILA